jgi:hypothetical protein
MPKRHLRVRKWIGRVPAIAFCSACNREFKVDLMDLKQLAAVQDSLTRQFSAHRCESEANDAPAFT